VQTAAAEFTQGDSWRSPQSGFDSRTSTVSRTLPASKRGVVGSIYRRHQLRAATGHALEAIMTAEAIMVGQKSSSPHLPSNANVPQCPTLEAPSHAPGIGMKTLLGSVSRAVASDLLQPTCPADVERHHGPNNSQAESQTDRQSSLMTAHQAIGYSQQQFGPSYTAPTQSMPKPPLQGEHLNASDGNQL
jgi:hypothetical protein